MNSEIIVVSGLPRSGTSLMMQMLANGGVEVITDNVRSADTDNPRGYYEFEPAKKIKDDTSWLPGARGKAFKMVSQLLYHLPSTERYHIIFMERDLDEMLVSQEKMLERLNRAAAPRAKIKESYVLHLERLHAWLRQQANMKVLRVSYNNLMEWPEQEAGHIRDLLGRDINIEEMAKTVDPSLYRNKKAREPGQA